MRTESWVTNHIIRSRLLPEAFFGAAYPEWDISKPEQTFSGFTYAIEVEGTHNNWDHFVGILYKKQYVSGSAETGIPAKQRDTEMMVRMKRGVREGTYQFMLNLYTLPGISSTHANLFELPIDTLINFYVRPYLIEPGSKSIYYLWDRGKAPHGLKGFPVGFPMGEQLRRETLPFIHI